MRDAARRLSGVRDVKVLIETSDQLIKGTDGRSRTLLLRTRAAFRKAQREAREELRVMNGVRDSATSITAASQRVRKWRLRKNAAAGLEAGFKRSYRRSRKAFDVACADPTPENLHEWRKQVKYLEQSMRVWNAEDRGRTKKLRKRAETLADMLGTDHDLVVFRERLVKLDAPSRRRPAIDRDIATRRRRLRAKALKQGRRLFKAKPSRFVCVVARAPGRRTRVAHAAA